MKANSFTNTAQDYSFESAYHKNKKRALPRSVLAKLNDNTNTNAANSALSCKCERCKQFFVISFMIKILSKKFMQEDYYVCRNCYNKRNDIKA